jgi:hypothetical protein
MLDNRLSGMVSNNVTLLLLLPVLLAQPAMAVPVNEMRALCKSLTEASLPSGDFAACGLSRLVLWGSDANLYHAKKCANNACMRIYAFIDAQNPTECSVDSRNRVGLRATVLEPLYASCADLATTPTPTPTQTEATAITTPTTTPPAQATPIPKAGSDETKMPPVSPVSPVTPTTSMPSSPANATPANASNLETQTPTTTELAVVPTQSKTGSSTKWILATVAVVVVVVAMVLALCYRRKRRAAAKITRPQPSETGTESSAHQTGSANAPDASLGHMDELLRDDLRLASWRLFATQLKDVAFLGNGSHAFVHLVELPNGTKLASKRLAPDQATPQHLTQLLGEVHIVATLHHASVVQFKGVTWTTALDFQVLFEYMQGGDLRTYLDRHPPSPWTPQKLEIALAIAEGLAYTHSFNQPLVHRDLKSRNILLTESHQAKISDFGVARFQSDNGTMTTGIGTTHWLAPEVLASGGTYNEKCDVYSFGVVMTELDSHEVPLQREIQTWAAPRLSDGSSTGCDRGASQLAILRAIANGSLRPHMSTASPPEVHELARRCLSFDASERPDALEISFRLRKLVGHKRKIERA